jgi:hypothetical protein
MKTFAIIVLWLAAFLASAWPLLAADLAIGTWVRRDVPMTSTIEPYGAAGWKITYHIKMGGKETVMTLQSALDGSEAAVIVDGKPSAETMAIKRLDDRHTFTTLKMNGQLYGTSKSEISADGKTVTVQDDMTAMLGVPGGKTTEIWDRK